ncbi:MAG: heavy metal translocating P-type ATPase [Clostridia bacterium]|nr:heavy metal translocating P-type ATPase [Clostridia bacterium]
MAKNKMKLIKTLACLSFFIIIIICSLIFEKADKVIWLILFSLVYLSAGYDVLYKAGRNVLRGKVFDENFLMAIASLGAFILGEYTEACAVMIFYQIGECFQSYAVGKSRKSIANLMDIRPDVARVIRDGKEENVDPDEVMIGDLITVRAGDKIPLDGVVVEGSCTLNTSALTGESKPLDVKKGDEVLSGCLCIDGVLTVEVKKEFYDSTVSKILDMVENASTKKARVENFISVFAKYYTPLVVISALLLAIIPSLITANWQLWTVRALTFLVVSCPCALVISVPLGFFGGIGGAGNKGVLIKGANYVEQISKANVFVLDKTGTLTKGEFSVVGVYPESKREQILKYACVCERHSNHPIAKSISSVYKTDKEERYEIEEIAGKGVVARGNGEEILCGNKVLLETFGVDTAQEEKHVEKWQTAVYIAINGKFLGVITLADTMRNEAREVIVNLKKQGAKVYMLTGDNEEVAREVANKLDITDYKYGLLPQDKMIELEQILQNKKEKDVVCFVGDGINDAPVLMRADVGISMGGIGSDSAIEASDAVLMHDSLDGIIKARKICKKTMRIVRQNIVFALAIKFSALILSVFGLGGMWYAVFADVGVSVLAILNSMRTLNVKKI